MNTAAMLTHTESILRAAKAQTRYAKLVHGRAPNPVKVRVLTHSRGQRAYAGLLEDLRANGYFRGLLQSEDD